MRTSRTNSQFQSLILTVLLLAILVVSINMVAFTQATTASSAPPSSVNVQVNDNNVQVQMHLVLTVNATILPLFHVMIDTAKNNTSESNNVTQPILTAIQKLVPNAKLDKFTLSASVVNMSNTYTLTEDYSFTVIGVTNQTGTLVNANLAFLHMNTTQSVKIHGNELNSVGSTYLVQSMNGLTRQNYDFYIDGSQSLTTQIPVQTTIRFWLLDYTWTPVIAAWNNTRNLVGQQTIWRYHPPTARYNLTLGRKSPEGTTYLAKGVAIFNPSLSITVPANAESNSNTVTFTVPNSEEIIMPVLIGIVIIILAITLVLDHRYSHRIVTSSRTRKKR